MPRSLLFVVLAVLIAMQHCQVVEIAAVQASEDYSTYLNYFGSPLDGGGDFVITYDIASNQTFIYKRDAEGMYPKFATKYVEKVPSLVGTNGEWFSSFYGDGVELFKVNQAGEVTDNHTISHFGVNFGKLLSNATYVAISSDKIQTYEYINSEWINTNNTSFPNVVFIALHYTLLTDDRLVIANDDVVGYKLLLISREVDKTWTLVDTLYLNFTEVNGLAFKYFFWDRANTLMFGVPYFAITGTYTSGAVVVVTKQNGEWSDVKWILADDLQLTGIGYLGNGPFLPLDDNNILVPSLDGFVTGFVKMGAYGLLSRVSGNWHWTARIKPKVHPGAFATIAKNKEDIVFFDCVKNDTIYHCYIYTTPLCFNQPIDVTCNNHQVLDSCSSIQVSNMDGLFTVNNPSCGQIYASFDSFTADSKGAEVDLTIKRSLAADAYCNITLSCPGNSPVFVTSDAFKTIVGLLAVVSALLALILQ